jgi:hypothetical protein
MEEVVVARFLLSLFLLLPAWAGEPEKTVILGRGSHGTPVPAFDQGYLLFTMHGSGFEVWGPDGFLRFFASVENPPGASVTTLAVDSDGSVAAGFAYLGRQAISGGIAYFDPSGKQTQFVDTGKYMPAHVCFDHDHSLWTFGWQRDPSSDYEETRDYMMFRKYLGGKETGRYGPRSIMPARGLEPGSPSLGLWRLRVANDRVGAMAYSGATSDNRVWVELGLDGHLIGKWAMGRDLQGGLAFTSSARLCRQTPAGKAKTPGIECLDRGTSAWEHAGDSPVPGLLLGADGDELVFSRNDGVITLHWAKVS